MYGTAKITPTPLENSADAPASAAGLDRRGFLGRSALTVAGVVGASVASAAAKADIGPLGPIERAARSYFLRENAAAENFRIGAPLHRDNGDEDRYPLKWGSYSKGLQHDANGQVLPDSYKSLLRALSTGKPADFEKITLGGPRPLTDPQAALGFSLEGPDSHAMYMPPAPALASAETAGEMVELYWMALARDVSYNDFDTDPTIAAACADLNKLSVLRSPKDSGKVTSATVFRGNLDGDLNGPLISQFLWQDMPYGALHIPQIVSCAVPGKQYMTTFDNWLAVQNGTFTGKTDLLGQPRYICTIRDLCQWVHVDALYEAYLNACLIVLGGGYPLDPGNPYLKSKTQTGFGTFGAPHILSLVTSVATLALKAVWYQKWAVHRRLRPEAYGGLVHLKTTKTLRDVPLHPDVLNSDAIAGGAVWKANAANNKKFGTTPDGSNLLPMAFSEGSPTHPAYGSGHATVAGACVTILKAWFDETTPIKNPVYASADGTELLPYTGPTLTLGGELNKVASNVGVGRDMAGVHWRTDYYNALLLGEALAIRLLQEEKTTYNESSSLSLTKFDGTKITI